MEKQMATLSPMRAGLAPKSWKARFEFSNTPYGQRSLLSQGIT
jgi:hypothetical protein